MNIYESVGITTFKSCEDYAKEEKDYEKDACLKKTKISDEKSSKSIIRSDSYYGMPVMNETSIRNNIISNPMYESSLRKENRCYKLLTNLFLLLTIILIIAHLVFHSFFYLPLNEKLKSIEKENKILEEKFLQLNSSISLKLSLVQQNVEQKSDALTLHEQIKEINFSLSSHLKKVVDLTNDISLLQSDFRIRINETRSASFKKLEEMDSKINELSNIEVKLKESKEFNSVSDLLRSNIQSFQKINEEFSEKLNKNELKLGLLQKHFENSSKLISKNLSDLSSNLKKRVPFGTVSIISLNESLRHFDSFGLGFGEYEGWYICNGLHGTPNLTGRFLVGKDDGRDFGYIGKTGGTSYVKLNVDQIPEHTHEDKGHRHQVELNSTENGEHDQKFYDFDYTNKRLKTEINSNLSAIEKASQHSEDVKSHIHSINGPTSLAKADLNLTGGNLEHENRPPFFVVVYVIYLEK